MAARQTRRPQDSDFYQQRLKAWQPILTPKWVVVTFLLVGLPFIGIGVALKQASDAVVVHRVQYDGDGADAGTEACRAGPGVACSLTINVTAAMAAPVFLYYELQNFYQNHRRYVRSRSDTQLAGTVYTDEGKVPECDPLRSANGKVLDPCGLVANSFFNDTFTLAASSPAGLSMSETGISWAADRARFIAPSAAEVAAAAGRVQFINETYPGVADVTNEHFIVWMRPAALPNFRKLYARFDADIPAGASLTFAVASVFPVDGFQGRKALVLSTTSVVGGQNAFLGWAYITVGAVAVGLAGVFGARSALGGRRPGDTSYLVWGGRR